MTKTLDVQPAELVEPGPVDTSMGGLIALAIREKSAIDVIERLTALKERADAAEAKRRWTEAVSGFKGECPPIFKTKEVQDKQKNLLYKWVPYEDIKAVTLPLERKYGITTGFSFDNTTATSLKATLRITVGNHTEEFVGAIPVPTETAGGVNATQNMGKAHTYLRRYLYQAAFDLVIAGEDSDAVGLIEKVTPDQIGKINDAIDACRKAGKWDEEGSLRAMLRAYEIDYLGDLPADRLLDLLADLDRQRRGGKK